MAEEESRQFVVCGDNALARRLVSELMNSYRARTTVIVPSTTSDDAAEMAALEPAGGDPALRPVVLAARRLSQDVFQRAGLPQADGLALLDQDDVANVDAALIAREVNPDVRIVLRMFNPVLGEGVAAMLGDCGVLSGSEIAAPAFVAAALGDGTPTYVRLPDQVLVVATRAEVGARYNSNDVLCGLAVTAGLADPVLLPADDDEADLVLVRVFGPQGTGRRRRRSRHPLRATRLLFGRSLRLILAGLVVVLLAGTVALAAVNRISLWRAFYLTVLTALGGGNANVQGSAVEQVLEVLLVVLGVALVPALTATVVEVVVRARLAIAAGGLTEPVSGHVIVVGLDNIGARVVRELHNFGVDVVGVDRSGLARGVQVARELGVPVVIGNANNAETLRAASVATSRALVVLTTDDVTNLETALLGRAVHRAADVTGTQLRVVLRLFDEDFAARVKRALDIDLSRSVSYLAAPAFAAALVGREVIDTISVGRHVLLVAEVPVGAGSQLEGKLYTEVNRPHQVRLVALRTGRGRQTLWSLPDRRPLVRTDRLLVVATRAGLAALLPRAAGVPDPPPLVEPEPLRLLLPRPPREPRESSP
jgi:Trk K+ transport system NAD-binding subunit